MRSLLGFFCLIVVVQLIGNAATSTNVSDWYQTLIKPAWNPPDYVFGPVWTFLYITIMLSGWLAYNAMIKKGIHTATKCYEFKAYFAHVFASMMWSIIFFACKFPLGGFVIIVFMVGAIAANIKLFYRHNKIAGLILIPYLLWVIYALTLNAAIVVLNQQYPA